MIKHLRRLFDWFRAREIRIFDIFLVILLVTSYMILILFDADMNLDFNFNLNTNIDSGYFCVLDKKGGLYIVDSGQERLFKVKDNKVEWEIIVGKKDKICEIENVVVGDDDSVYVHETQWDETGFLVENELICKYGSDGKYIETQYVLTYDEKNKKDKPELFDLRVVDGHVEYIIVNDQGFEVFEIVDNREVAVKSKYLFEDAITYIQSIVASPNNRIYMVDKRGKILCADEQSCIYTYYTFKEDVVPYDLAVGSDESIYYTDLRSKSVGRISPRKELQEIFSEQSVFKDVTMDKNQGLISNVSVNNVTFGDGSEQDVICGIFFDIGTLYAVKQNGELVCNQSNFDLGEGYFISTIIVFIASIIAMFCIVVLGIRLIVVALFNMPKLNIIFVVEITIVLTVAVTLTVILPVFLSSITDTYIRGESEKILSIVEIISKNIDSEKLRNINKASDFMNDDYKDILEEFRVATFYSYDSEQPIIGGTIEKIIDDTPVCVMYPHVRTGAYVPRSLAESKEIVQVYATKKSVIREMHSKTGDYLMARYPIFGDNKEVVGCVAVVKDMTLMRAINKSLIEQTVINLLSFVILGIFIVNETMVFIRQRKEHKNKIQDRKTVFKQRNVASYHILRVSNVIFSMSLNISSVFLPIYILSFNVPDNFSEFGIPMMVVGSMPISVNVAFVFLASAFSFSIFQQFGFKKVIIFASCCLILGDIMLAIIDSYNMLLLAMFINGVGYGLLIESKRSYLDQLPYDELNRIQVFCSSGESSGKFLGLFIGGFLVAILEYKEVFWMAVLLDIIAFGFCVYFYKTYVGSSLKNSDKKSKMSILEFLMAKQILSYLIIIPTILGILIGFAGYYIPIYGSVCDFYENEISLSLAVVAFCPAFFALSLTKAIIKRFDINSIYIAILTALGAMLLLVNFKQLALFISSLLLLGFSYSFGLGACRYRFSQMDKVKEYGENRAQSIYNLFYSLGMFISPLLFGYMLAKDFATYMWIFIISVIVIIGLYKIIFDRKKNVN